MVNALLSLPTPGSLPDPQFSHKIPAGRRSSRPAPGPAPGGQPDPSPRAGRSSSGQLRWARCPDDGLLHLLHPADVVVAATGDHAEALCGRQLPAESLTLINGSTGALCMACVAGIPPDRALRDLFLTNADRGDNAANDELVAGLVRRIRAQQGSRDCRD